MLTVYEFTDYKKFVRNWLKTQPKHGLGFFTQFAERVGTSSAAISQIFNDVRELNLEHAVELSEMLSLGEDESYYFLLLVEYARAGSAKLQKKLLAKIKSEQIQQQKLINRIPKDRTLTEEIKSIYYSSWLYTGIRNLIAIESIQTIESLVVHTKISKTRIQKVIQFLIEHQFLKSDGGKLIVLDKKTHLENTSPWVTKHHQNWRIKSMEAMQNYDEGDLFYSSPMSLSEEVAQQVRQQLPELIKQINERVGPSKSEVVRCLNIDWFRY